MCAAVCVTLEGGGGEFVANSLGPHGGSSSPSYVTVQVLWETLQLLDRKHEWAMGGGRPCFLYRYFYRLPKEALSEGGFDSKLFKDLKCISTAACLHGVNSTFFLP